MVLYEDFFSYIDPTNEEASPKHTGNLRRQMQTAGVCRATSPASSFFDGDYRNGKDKDDKDDDDGDDGDCSGTYSCSCTGSTETSCNYCRLETNIRPGPNILCQVTGSSTTYTDVNLGGVRTCSCEYIGNGQTRQTCWTPTPRPTDPPVAPVAPPVTAPTTPSPVVIRAPVVGDESVPEPTLGVATGVLPSQGSCEAKRQFNSYLCLEKEGSNFCDATPVTCDMLPEYSCTCSGTETLCNYCQVRTADSIICQVAGSSMTFVAPDFTAKTCTCEQIGNGQARQVCSTPTSTTRSFSLVAGGDIP